MITAFYSVYGCARYFEDSLKSIINYVDDVIIIHGPYIGFPELKNQDEEKKKYLRIAKKYGCRFIECGPMTQPAKRSLIFKFAPRGEWIFMIDDDEICYGDVGAGMEKIINAPRENIFGFVWIDDEALPFWRVRFIRNIEGMSFGPKHWQLNLHGEIVSEYTSTKLPSIYIHDFKIKNTEDIKKDEEYNRAMNQYRAEIWKKNFIES